MPANDLRRALDDAIWAHENGKTTCDTLPNLKAVLREVARLHAETWFHNSASSRQREWLLTLPADVGVSEAITASPEWRDAFQNQYDIDPKEIEI